MAVQVILNISRDELLLYTKNTIEKSVKTKAWLVFCSIVDFVSQKRKRYQGRYAPLGISVSQTTRKVTIWKKAYIFQKKSAQHSKVDLSEKRYLIIEHTILDIWHTTYFDDDAIAYPTCVYIKKIYLYIYIYVFRWNDLFIIIMYWTVYMKCCIWNKKCIHICVWHVWYVYMYKWNRLWGLGFKV